MNKVYAIIYPIVCFFFWIVHPWRAVGQTQLPEGGVLLCGNHTGLSDPIYVLMTLGRKRQCRVLAKAELLRIPVLGAILKSIGIIGVARGRSDVGAIKTAMKALKNDERLLMFPEGTRVSADTEGDAHSGAAMLATRTGVPVVPIFIPREKKWFRKTTVVYGEAYYPEYDGDRPTPEDYKRISVDLMKRIYALEEQAK